MTVRGGNPIAGYCKLEPRYEKLEDEEWCLQHARIESHFFSNGCWVEDGQLLKQQNIEMIRHIPSEYSGLRAAFGNADMWL